MLQQLGSKLHILIAIVFFVIAIYLAIIYREIKSLESGLYAVKEFETQLEALKKDLEALEVKLVASKANAALVVPGIPPIIPVVSGISVSGGGGVAGGSAIGTTSSADAVTAAGSPPTPDDDDLSVTSNEIKDIITNLKDLPDDDVDDTQQQEPLDGSSAREVEDPQQASEKLAARHEIRNKPLEELVEEDLQKLKYDDLRTILRRQGLHNIKGRREELVEKILAIKSEKTKA